LVDKNELEKLHSSNRVITLQYDFEVAKREHCERQLARLQDNIKQLQSELSYMDEKVKRADDQMKLNDRLNRDNKDECEISQLKIMDLEKRLNLTEKDKDIIEQELLIVKQKMEATTYRMQRYNDALINADHDLDQMSDTRFVDNTQRVHVYVAFDLLQL
jgi:predicted nuclease with TOPRIM domain